MAQSALTEFVFLLTDTKKGRADYPLCLLHFLVGVNCKDVGANSIQQFLGSIANYGSF